MGNNKYYYHFGICLENDKVKKHITKQNYLFEKEYEKFKPTSLTIQNSQKNFDINMKYFQGLNSNSFFKELFKVVAKYNFEEVKDLNKHKKDIGIYILVLGKYNQMYIGQTSNNFRNRIVRHWRNELDVFHTPFIRSNILPIDCFGALDTTQIYILRCENQKEIDRLEEKIISDVSIKYLLNKTIGGKSYNPKDVVDRVLFKRLLRDWESQILDDDYYEDDDV